MTDLLAGKEITGEGCAPAEKKEEGGEEAAKEGYKVASDDDIVAIHTFMDGFKETGKSL